MKGSLYYLNKIESRSICYYKTILGLCVKDLFLCFEVEHKVFYVELHVFTYRFRLLEIA
jgi:hypothetical protein